MSTQVTVSLTDETFQRASHLARLSGRPMPDLLADTIALSLSPLGGEFEPGRSVTILPDGDVLTLANLHLDPAQDRRLSLLLHRQQAGSLTTAERSELFGLMQVYQEGLLRKAQGMREAVRPGLLEPLAP